MAIRQCPPGIFCVTPMFIMCLIGVSLSILIGAYLVTRDIKLPKIVIEMPKSETTQNIVVENENDRYKRAPEPLRNWLTQPDLRGALIPQGAAPIFQPARGYLACINCSTFL